MYVNLLAPPADRPAAAEAFAQANTGTAAPPFAVGDRVVFTPHPA